MKSAWTNTTISNKHTILKTLKILYGPNQYTRNRTSFIIIFLLTLAEVHPLHPRVNLRRIPARSTLRPFGRRVGSRLLARSARRARSGAGHRARLVGRRGQRSRRRRLGDQRRRPPRPGGGQVLRRGHPSRRRRLRVFTSRRNRRSGREQRRGQGRRSRLQLGIIS